MTDLREQLAKQLQQVQLLGIGFSGEQADRYPWTPVELVQWGRIADEVLRQMAWAQSQVYAVPGGPPDVTASLPLTLAPPGWQP
jgi:hypothetical protein